MSVDDWIRAAKTETLLETRGLAIQLKDHGLLSGIERELGRRHVEAIR